MPILSRDDALALTSPCHQVWVEAHEHAWGLWCRGLMEVPEMFKPLTASDRAVFLHRHIYEYAARQLDGVVRSTDALGFNGQLVDDRALVRFKYLHRDLRPRAVRTEQQEHLEDQEFTDDMMGQLSLEGVAAAPTLLTCGYTLTLGEDAISGIRVACWDRGVLRYWYDLLAQAGEGGGEVVPLFPASPPDQPRVVSARVKREEERRKQQDGQ